MKKVTYPFWEKYKIEVQKMNNGMSLRGDPMYPNGHLLATLFGHTPIKRNNQPITFCQEINEIKQIVANNDPEKRYPLIDEHGQICIYSEMSFLYDTLRNKSVIGEMDTFDSIYDEKDEIPIMSIPTMDLVGLLKDTIEYHKSNTWELKFGGRILESDIKTIHKILDNESTIKSEIRYRIIGEQIRAKTSEYEIFIDSFNNTETIDEIKRNDYNQKIFTYLFITYSNIIPN